MFNVKLFCGDNVEVMRREIPDASIQLTVTSPPYDNLRKYNGYAWDFEAVARELYRVTKQGGVVVWVVADATVNGSETGTSFRQALYFKECGFNLWDTMIWEKDTFNFPCPIRYRSVFEYMFVFSKGNPGAGTLLFDRPNATAGSKVHGTNRQADGLTTPKVCMGAVTPAYGMRFNVWRIPGWKYRPDGTSGKHPASFPEQLAADHVLSWSNPGDLVLDPFCGSGTTGKMAVLNGREFIGIDISSEYVALATGRINAAVTNEKLLLEREKTQ